MRIVSLVPSLTELLCELGPKVLPVLERYLLEAGSISWALRVLSTVAPGEALWHALEALLVKIEPGYARDPTRKLQLLTFLRELDRDPRAAGMALPFLADVDENVRFTAVDVILGHGDEAIAGPLAEAVITDESVRIRQAIVEGLIARDLALPLRKLIADGVVRTEGEKRSTQYFPGESGGGRRGGGEGAAAPRRRKKK